MLKSINYAAFKKGRLLKLSLMIVGCTVFTACNEESNEASLDQNEMPLEEIQIDVGTQYSNIKWNEQLGEINLYRFSNKDCDIENYTNCDDSQLTIINSIAELPIKDSFLNEYTDTPVYIKIVGDGLKSDLIEGQAKVPDFPGRHGMQMVKFNERMFIIGGIHGTNDTDTYYNDIWSSENGINWQLEAENAEFSARSQHQVIEFNNKLWLFSGEIQLEGGGTARANDVWSSEDGVHWVLVYEDLPVDFVVAFNERIWAFGKNEIYSSETGNDWVLEESDWSQRFQSENTVNPSKRFRGQYAVFKNKIWLIAGQSGQDYSAKNDVWSSVDGVNWVIETTNAQFNARLGHAIAVYGNKIWLSGGYDSNDSTYNDVWSSEDGVNWTLENEKITQTDHQNHQVISFDNKMWLYGEINDQYLWQSSNGKDWYIVSLTPVNWETNE